MDHTVQPPEGRLAASSETTAYVVTQALTSVGTTYHVCKPKDRRVVFTITAVPQTMRFRLIEGEDGAEVGALTSNFIRSRYEIHARARLLASVVFPAVAFDKTMTLTVGDDVYEGEGGIYGGVFECKTKDGATALEIAKQLSIRDTFSVRSTAAIPHQVALLSAVAIHARFYQMN